MTGRKRRKGVAAFFLCLLIVQDFYPAAAYALTSGPSQPEMQKFSPAGANDMVDLFSGDFKYDIPLMDVGGYPLNLSYHSGSQVEDEASWVGAGWTLNPGAVNRTMRGIPDDFTGDNSAEDPQDAIQTIQSRKAFQKIGADLVIKPTLFGFNAGSASLKVGVYKDNYYGIGAELGASVNFDLDQNSSPTLTAGLGLTTDSRTGVTLQPSFTLAAGYDQDKENNNTSLTGGFTYNTRSGLESVNLSQSFKAGGNSYDDYGEATGSISGTFGVGSFTKSFAHTFVPSLGYSSAVTDATFSFDLGAALFGGYLGVGGEGYVHTQKSTEPQSTVPAYGYLHYPAGLKNRLAMLDFNREKDGPYMINQPAIPVPVSTEDYFEATSQAGMQQFRPCYNGNYIVYDRPFAQSSSSTTAGFTVGAGNIFQTGAQLDLTGGQALTQGWTGTDYASAVAPTPGNALTEGVYFKQAGEQTKVDNNYFLAIGGFNTQAIVLNGSAGSAAKATTGLVGASGQLPGAIPIGRINRDVRTTTFSYLTALQASQYGLDKTINGTPRYDLPAANPVQTVHKPHHISEITVTDKEGKRMVYGIPVYNTDREEVSMSVLAPTAANFQGDRLSGLIPYNGLVTTDNTPKNNQGRENIYNRKIIPPYATSYLLTGILSPDYVDLQGDGITDDDLGTAVKFNYKKMNYYHWRAPYEAGVANYNEGYLSDQQDDKGNYVFGTKELWYLDTIRSKTLVAVFFTSDRQDGLGVLGESGGQSRADVVQELDSVRLFSSADLAKNGLNAIPIKVAHFLYDSSIYQGLPNNKFKGGKLTLKKLWFTFGASSRGQTNPYIFTYNNTQAIGGTSGLPTSTYSGEATDQYAPRQTDRWGTYRQNYFTTPAHVFYNSEFPYSTQASDNGPYDERLAADLFAAKWQLSSIITPTGGTITVNYESDDYSYVQDQKAMIMCQLAGVGTSGSSSGLGKATALSVTLPVGASYFTDLANTYLSGPNGQNRDNIFYKISVDLDNKGHNEYVCGYAEVDYSDTTKFIEGTNTQGVLDPHIWSIPLKSVNSYNPVAVQAWQLLQTDLPQYAYPNYDNSGVSGFSGTASAVIRSVVQAFVNLRELGESFDDIAKASNYANKVDLTHSLVRLDYPVGKANGESTAAHKTYGKLGGGSRVRTIELSDNWGNMLTGTSGIKTVAYGIQYDYTMLDDKGDFISSGVASYEPEIGNEENPFHQPVDYTEKVQWGTDRYHYMELPYGESYFPSPGVGYSQVKATTYGVDRTNGDPQVVQTNTGYTLSQFYTAKDFPTQVDYLPLQQQNYENDLTLLLFGSRYTDRVTTSQGFKIITNDMHGKQKSTQVVDNNGNLITGTQYTYNVADPNAQRKTLNNTVTAMDADGTIPGSGMLIGTDADLVTDLRESSSTSNGTSIGGYIGGLVFPFLFPVYIPYATVNYSATASTRTYNSASTVKVIHQYGLLQEVRTTQNGSTLTADNLLWDAQTGQVLLTRNQNEFGDYTYSLNYAAFHGYDGMSGAYKNLGAVFSGFTTDPGGTGIVNAAFTSYLSPGDELVDVDPGANPVHGWVIQPVDGSLRLVDATGNFITANGTYMVIRSGRRNLLDASAGSVVTKNNSLVQGGSGYILQANVNQQVLDAKAVTYKDEWGVPVPNILIAPQPTPEQPIIPYSFTGKNEATVDRTYNITDGTAPTTTCYPAVFQAQVSVQEVNNVPLAVTTRGFLDFNSPTVPKGATINKVTLNLTAVSGQNSGTNEALIQRVTQQVYCGGNNTPAWANQPTTTTVDEVTVPQITATTTSYIADLTKMFTDWYNAQDIATFAVALELVGDNQPTARAITFSGASGATPPTLNITYTNPAICTNPLNQIINPYYYGVKGNWRPNYNYVYQVNRVQVPGNSAQAGGTNIRTSGYYNSYTPFWVYTNGSMEAIPPVAGSPGIVADPRWVWRSQSIYYDQKGNEIENVDALNRSSAVLFGYQQSLATGVAANARHNEIAFDGFEDYYFSLPATPGACPPLPRQLDFGFTQQGSQYCSSGGCIVSGISHTGNYSLNLSGTVNYSASAGAAIAPTQWIGYDGADHSILLANEQASGFAPINGKNYLLSLWVNDGSPTTNTISGLTVTINSVAQPFSSTAVPVVEGWKQLSLTFIAGSTFSLQLSGGANVYIDDLRLLPFDGEMKTFVYDDQSLRLMGQLDENNFGILYEYDEEGTPIRVKKETERGIMTVKENRQSLNSH